MRCPSTKNLKASFKKLDTKKANLVRALAKAVDSADDLETLVENSCPETVKYVRSLYSDPYRSQMWRRTVALHAIDDLIGGHGMEPLGPVGHSGPPYEYSNMGDPYVTTLIYKKATDNLFIGCYGGTAERHPNW